MFIYIRERLAGLTLLFSIIAAFAGCEKTNTNTDQYIRYTVNGVSRNIFPADSTKFDKVFFTSYVIPGGGGIVHWAYGGEFSFAYADSGIGLGSIQRLIKISSSASNVMFVSYDRLITPDVNVYITEYGNTGEYISGHFAGTVHYPSSPNDTCAINCSFRLKRTFN